MLRLAVVLSCGFLFLIDCACRPKNPSENATPDAPAKTTASYREQQKRLFYEIDHKLVYQACQELLRSHREGKLSSSAYYCDDPAAKLSELPDPIRKLVPTAVQIDEMMVRMTFLSPDGTQHLDCVSNEFGEPTGTRTPKTSSRSPKSSSILSRCTCGSMKAESPSR